jgi:hypothetical protein
VLVVFKPCATPRSLKSDKNGEFQENCFVVDSHNDGYIFGGVQRQCAA